MGVYAVWMVLETGYARFLDLFEDVRGKILVDDDRRCVSPFLEFPLHLQRNFNNASERSTWCIEPISKGKAQDLMNGCAADKRIQLQCELKAQFRKVPSSLLPHTRSSTWWGVVDSSMTAETGKAIQRYNALDHQDTGVLILRLLSETYEVR
ncbi:hypothetical protein BGZ60DRAFT_434548 [Tricladium varicosporioides]|nr:hypothetical protein BGZ60DRAFT_434548 [Hymenoscyphus varicosporioides]